MASYNEDSYVVLNNNREGCFLKQDCSIDAEVSVSCPKHRIFLSVNICYYCLELLANQ